LDVPVVDGQVDTDTLAAIVREHAPVAAIIEKVAAMPGQGVSSTFKFGMAYGALRATVSVLQIPSYLVSPQRWKRDLGLTSDKEESRAMAIRLWPGVGCFSRKADHNRAEAALLARYGVRMLDTKKAA
jgi:crossover junction endodeoxyribonuclease RuvC